MRPGGGSSQRSSTSTSPVVHTAMLEAISSPLGFTTLARKMTMGVAATATAPTSNRLRLHRAAVARANPKSADEARADSTRMR